MPPEREKISVGWRERLCINSDQHGGVEERARDSGIGETPNQRVKCEAGSRQEAHDRAIFDLIGQPKCKHEALVGCEKSAHTQERTFRAQIRLS